MSVQAANTYEIAKPYGAVSLGVAITGGILCLAASNTAAIVMSVALAILGSYAFIGVLLCYLDYKKDPQGFEENVGKYVVTAASMGIADIVSTVARLVLIKLIFGDRS